MASDNATVSMRSLLTYHIAFIVDYIIFDSQMESKTGYTFLQVVFTAFLRIVVFSAIIAIPVHFHLILGTWQCLVDILVGVPKTMWNVALSGML